MYSEEHKLYLKQKQKSNIFVSFTQLLVVLLFTFCWEYCANKEIINPFIFSSPIRVVECFLKNNFTKHILVTLSETIISFILSLFLGLIISSILWINKTFSKIVDPFLSILNSLPKVALGPILIIWCGANTKTIIIMSLLISLFTCVINFYEAFMNTNQQMITLLESYGANNITILKRLIIPYNLNTIISTMKITSSMCLVGVIMGEMLVSKEGLGYLIVYGSQIFNLSLIITSIIILALISYMFYKLILILEKNRF